MSEEVECVWIEDQLKYTGSWSTISYSLTENITPFMYGRYFQLVMDFPSFNYYEEEDMMNYICQCSPDQIIHEARTTINKITEKISIGSCVDNGLCRFDSELPFLNHRENYMLYLGRCIQFLFDNDGSSSIVNLLTCSDYKSIFDSAHKLKRETLIRKDDPYEQVYLDDTHPSGGIEGH